MQMRKQPGRKLVDSGEGTHILARQQAGVFEDGFVIRYPRLFAVFVDLGRGSHLALHNAFGQRIPQIRE
jgi:hypothetical protein